MPERFKIIVDPVDDPVRNTVPEYRVAVEAKFPKRLVEISQWAAFLDEPFEPSFPIFIVKPTHCHKIPLLNRLPPQHASAIPGDTQQISAV
jgi:hypothetical protein